MDTKSLFLSTSPKSDPHNWTHYESNPILTMASGGMRSVAAIKEADGTYRVLYDRNPNFCYAYGSDLTDLTKHSETDDPVFTGTGVVDDFDRYIRHPALIKVGSTYHMYYDGREDGHQGEIGAIGHATSTDMINWTRDDANNPVVDVGLDEWESSDVGSQTVIEIDGTYYMFYSGYDGNGSPWKHEIGYATSTNLTDWTKYANNPVLRVGSVGSWDEDLIQRPAMLFDGTDWYMYYAGRANLVNALGYATWNM